MNAIPDADLEGYDRDKRLERVLYAFKGEPQPAVNLMEAIDMDFTIRRDSTGAMVIIPHTAYVEFYHRMKRAGRFFDEHGFHLNYYGHPFADVCVRAYRPGD